MTYVNNSAGESSGEGRPDGDAEAEGEGEIEGEAEGVGKTEGEAETDGVCIAETLGSAGADPAVCACDNGTKNIRINASAIPLTSQPSLDITSPNREQLGALISAGNEIIMGVTTETDLPASSPEWSRPIQCMNRIRCVCQKSGNGLRCLVPHYIQAKFIQVSF